ncbi:MAG TPA: DnaJ domain-containing protein [Acidimicrobiales bacterium]|nr:DnaJ domain-containing protein [Acidimicrobiales bacterium]
MDGSRARALLGVPAHATEEEVRRAFRRAARRAHPDAGGDASVFRTLLAARDVLAAAAPLARPAGSWDPVLREPRVDLLDVARRWAEPSPPPPAPDFDALLAAALVA